MGDNEKTFSSVISSITSLASVFTYIHKRQKIPKLSFDEYFKFEQPFISGNISNKVTYYCIRIKDINAKSEGQIRSCAGSLTINGSIYKTVWLTTNKRHHTFVKEACLKLFDVDSRDDTIGYFNTIDETEPNRLPGFYGRRVSDNITIQLESARGHCPEPITVNVEYIIKNAKMLNE